MATVQTDGTSVVTKQSTVNNGGIITANGTAASDVVRTESTASAQVGVFGSTVVDNDSADKALSAGKFAFNNKKPIAKKVTTSLAGVAEPFFKSGAGDPGSIQSIHQIRVIRTRRDTTAIRQGNWNYYNGQFDPGYPVVAVDEFYDVAADATSVNPTDNAANPTQEVPGELVYKTGAPNPVQDAYAKKTVY